MKELTRINRNRFWRIPMTLWGRTLVPYSADRLLALWLHRLKLMGNLEKTVFSEIIKPGMRVADVGANQGIYTLLFSDLVGCEGTVYSFEPEPFLFESLQKNCNRNHITNVECFPFGLGEKETSVSMMPGALNSGDNRVVLSETAGAISVMIRRIDQVLQNVALDFVKIDVQGYELEVLKGMRGLLQARPEIVVFFEYWPFGLRKVGSEPEELIKFLQAYNFQITVVKGSQDDSILIKDSESLAPYLGNSGYVNLLARRR